ncbi:GGDEF domain-containing protein [Prosthecomicrobium sp. N25]|uniref:GGDEF domain-containing protein n=1 Tax=Prosthecomicrobium sp. N25 TaxID=3129254 RepID=UPI003078446D
MRRLLTFSVDCRRDLLRGVLKINAVILFSTIAADILLQALFFAGWPVFFRSLAFTLAITLAVIGPVVYIFVTMFAQLHRANQQVERLSRVDTLTGLANRRAFMERVASHGDAASAFAILDIDLFKRINDRHGHPAGDQVLEAVAARLGATLEPFGMLARIGGEEFAFLGGPGTADDIARQLEAARAAIAATPIATTTGAIPVTISVGLAFRQDFEAEQLYGVADMALYQAKTSGRNRIEVAGRHAPDRSDDLIWLDEEPAGADLRTSAAA